MSPPTPKGKSSFDFKDLYRGSLLQCAEAATVGLPFEVWKTYMGSNRDVNTIKAFRNIYNDGGVLAFWRGFKPKMVESFFKGGILLFAKESIISMCASLGMSEVGAGLVGGFGGGVAQVSVMGPCTFLVTAAVTNKEASFTSVIRSTISQHGIAGFYRGGTALMLRQGSNWASRQGLTDLVRTSMKKVKDVDQLSVGEEALSGIIGGSLSTWNQPFEVLRIEAQYAVAKGLPAKGIMENAATIVKSNGLIGLYAGVIPRMGLCIAQTLFMVTIPHLIKNM